MGFLRRFLLVIVSVILFLLFLAGNFIFTLSSSLEYEHVKPEIVSLLGDVLEEQIGIDEHLNQLSPVIMAACALNSQYTFTYGGANFVIPCDVALQGSTALVEYGISSFVDKYYYAEYDCEFLDCFEEQDIPLFLISEKARDFWRSKFHLVLLLSIALAILIFFLVEKKTNFFILVGSLLVVSAFPLVRIANVASFFTGVLGAVRKYPSKIVLIFFNQAHSTFMKSLLIGGTFIVVGIILKLFHVGFSISNFIEKLKSKKTGKSQQIFNKKKKEKKPIKKSK